MIIGITASCFDMFHAGHVLMLKEAKTVCDYLIVALQTDPTIDRPEKNKPVQSIYERFVQVSGCKYVDEVLVYDTEEDLLNVLTSREIHVRILGEEYKEKTFTGQNLPHTFYFNKRKHKFSTTELRERVKKHGKETFSDISGSV
jgi:glycerol-3-phosphate cytidylyltransferase